MSEESLEKRILRRLVYHPESMSRNQNFHAFDSDDGRRIRRLAARIRSLQAAFRSPNARVSYQRSGEEHRITIDDSETGVHRETFLSPDAYAVLIEDSESLAALSGTNSETQSA